ncbi:MAG: hypothetical protein UX71_C0013G0013 [Parcubacteria group bacterium GW2011_GWA1_47_10]|nr:MAG: hypothetical protein UX71_C0013G0013 [Parcubacteria group bacterium GW2011_GWA1_47_10]
MAKNKTQEEINAEIIKRLENLEKVRHTPSEVLKRGKQKTLPEITKGKKLKNGQQKVAIIVAYYEKFLSKPSVTTEEITQGWRDGKFDGSFARTLLDRAISDGLVRDLKDGTFDLSQSGEGFYEEYMK